MKLIWYTMHGWNMIPWKFPVNGMNGSNFWGKTVGPGSFWNGLYIFKLGVGNVDDATWGVMNVWDCLVCFVLCGRVSRAVHHWLALKYCCIGCCGTRLLCSCTCGGPCSTQNMWNKSFLFNCVVTIVVFQWHLTLVICHVDYVPTLYTSVWQFGHACWSY